MISGRLLCLGEPLVEFSDAGNGSWRGGIGGDVSNVAIAAARQGADVAMLARLGDDAFGAMIRQVWDEEGVDHRHVAAVTGAETGLYFITYRDGAHHFEYRRANSAAAQMQPQDLPEEAFAGAGALHLSGISQAISASAHAAADRAVALARQSGVKISYDPNLRLKLWPLERARAAAEATIAQADIVLPGYEDARQLTGLDRPEDILSHYRGLGAGLVAMTMGGEGVLVSFDQEVQHFSAPKVQEVDASGAGDCFDGAFLAQVLQGCGVPEAAQYATAAAALSVTRYGAALSVPTAQEVKAAFPDHVVPGCRA